MSLTIKIPSKSFLVGEYFVLDNGRAILLNTKPFFELTVTKSSKTQIVGINENSPAGLYLNANKDLFSGCEIMFNDPHRGAGGFGASSAQFVACFYAIKAMGSRFELSQLDDSCLELWRAYQTVHTDRGGRLPSGADVLSQTLGQIAEVSLNPFSFDRRAWPFSRSGFVLAATGNKIATHEHLKKINQQSYNDLGLPFNKTVAGLKLNDFELFNKGINEYREVLNHLSLEAKTTSDLIDNIKSSSPVSAIKGCGAMGADVLFMTFEIEDSTKVIDCIQKLNLRIVATQEDITDGVTIKSVHNESFLEPQAL